jgi:ABC-2 type transport system permease protein
MSFLAVLKQELQTILKDSAIMLSIVGGVFLYAFLYPQPYTKQTVSHIPVVVVDKDCSTFSRNLIRTFESSAFITIVAKTTSTLEAKHFIQTKKASAMLIIPKNFQKELFLHHVPTVSVAADGTYFLIFGAVFEAALQSVLKETATFKIVHLFQEQVPPKIALQQLIPFGVTSVALFNPQNSYIQYILPAVFVLILHQILLIGLGILGGGVNERYYRSYNYKANPLAVLFSRFIIFFTLFFLHALFYFGFVFDFFSVLHKASISDLLFLISVFLFAVIGFGLFLGTLFQNRSIATPVVLLSSLPLVFSAGFVWPISLLPSWINTLTLFFPAKPAIESFLKLNQMGASLHSLDLNIFILLSQGVLYMFLAYWNMKKIYIKEKS